LLSPTTSEAKWEDEPANSSSWRWYVQSYFLNSTKANAPFAGPSGLAALKNLREEGFSVTVFERRDSIGGVWAYTDDVDMTTTLPCEAKLINSDAWSAALTAQLLSQTGANSS
jgi:NADPH-dependent 2,4-dienoyl-CoA reductase/sulfur reductase-like enzyme